MVDGIDKLQDKNLADHRLARFPNVSKICFSSQDTDVVANHEFLWTVIQMCSRATDLDLRNVKINLIGDLFFLLTHGRGCDATLYRRLWLKAGTHLSLTGDDFCGAKNLREVYLDSVVFFYDGPFKQVYQVLHGFETEFGLLHKYPGIEKLSIKGATFVDTVNGGPLPQEFIIKFVRTNSNLRWLRSDLMEHIVAMLKEERPEITFVSD